MNDSTKKVVNVIFRQVIPFLAGLWLLISLIALGSAGIGWRDFVTGDFVFGMMLVMNIGYLIITIRQASKIVGLLLRIGDLEKKIDLRQTAAQSTNEPPSMPWEFYDSIAQAEVEATEARDFYLSPEDDPFWPPEQPEDEK